MVIMQVQIKGETKQLNVQTITLQPEDGNNLYGFHCLNCGNFHQKIGGKVSKIYPIYEPSDQVPTISRCRNCGQEYNFQTHDGYSSDKIKVVLSPLENVNYFYCYKGKDKILEYTSSYILSKVENKMKNAPFFSHCSNTSCETIYYFVKMV
jgi:uncharacterized Zn finger protein